MEPMQIVVKQLLSPKETADGQSIILSDWVKWPLVFLAGATILIGSDLLVDDKISCAGDYRNMDRKSVETRCVSESYTVSTSNSLGPGVGRTYTDDPVREELKTYQSSYPLHFHLLCVGVALLYLPIVMARRLKGRNFETFFYNYSTAKENSPGTVFTSLSC
jgi:hypothetical protein